MPIEPNMSYTFQNIPIYGIDGLSGKKIQIGKYDRTFSDYGALGGKLYYLDSESDEIVEFLNNEGNVVTMEAVEQAFANSDNELIDSLVAYKISDNGTSGKDKCYVYYDEIYSYNTWTYKDSDNNWKYESLGTAAGIGQGKSNTDLVMAKSEYVDGYGSIWYQLKDARDNKIGGYDDWFIPSKEEVEALRSAIGYQVVPRVGSPDILSASAVTGGVIAGVADGLPHYVSHEVDGSWVRTCYPSETPFLDSPFWSSSEDSVSSETAFIWDTISQSWITVSKSGDDYSKYKNVFFVRSF